MKYIHGINWNNACKIMDFVEASFGRGKCNTSSGGLWVSLPPTELQQVQDFLVEQNIGGRIIGEYPDKENERIFAELQLGDGSCES